MRPAGQDLRRALAQRTGTDPNDWFLCERARHGIWVVMRALAEQFGPSEIVTQALTCLTAVSPIVAAGHRPRYGDISSHTFALDLDSVRRTPLTRALVWQHTFGMITVPAMIEARAWCDRAGVLLIEDSAHALARMGRVDGVPLADVSIHSFGAEKIAPTHVGGAVWVNPECDRHVRARIRQIVSHMRPALAFHELGYRTYHLQRRLYSHTGPLGAVVRDQAERIGLWRPPVSQADYAAATPIIRTPPDWVVAQARVALDALDSNEAARQRVSAYYASELGGDLSAPNQPLCRYPLLVDNDAEKALTAMWKRGHYIGRWYRPLLFPGTTDPRFCLDETELPVSANVSERILNAPTTVGVDEARALVTDLREILAQQTSN